MQNAKQLQRRAGSTTITPHTQLLHRKNSPVNAVFGRADRRCGGPSAT